MTQTAQAGATNFCAVQHEMGGIPRFRALARGLRCTSHPPVPLASLRRARIAPLVFTEGAVMAEALFPGGSAPPVDIGAVDIGEVLQKLAEHKGCGTSSDEGKASCGSS